MTETGPTGQNNFNETKFIKYKFGKYEITVAVTLDNKFIGITEVKASKDFRSYAQKLASTKVFDVGEYYKDE